jgi:RNA polymerase-binding transcription factor
MDAAELQHYESQLIQLRGTLQTELKQASEESAPVQLDTSIGRLSRGAAMQAQQMAMEMKRRREERLLRIQSALQRVGKGTYGACARCTKPIDGERLTAFPDVVLCVGCTSGPKP